MIEISIDLLIRVIVMLSGLLISLSIYLTYQRIREVSLQKKKKKYILENQNKWYQYLNHEGFSATELIPMNECEIKGVEEIFLAYIQNLSNPEIQEKIKDFSNQYLRQYYLKLLHSKRWSLRMNAMYRIVDFQIDSLVSECEKIEGEKLSNDERFHLLVIHAVFNPDTFLKEFFALSITFSEYEYKKLLLGVNSEILIKLIGQMDKLPLDCQYSLIDVLGIKRNIEYLTFLEGNLQHENLEIRIRSLKAITEIGVVTDLEKYLHFVASSLWEERLMMAKLLGNFSLSRSYPYLVKLLEDESWWVRSQAAKTIKQAKHGKVKLESYIHSARDQYAIDMANEAVQKGL